MISLVWVKLPFRSYPIHIGYHLLENELLFAIHNKKQVFILSSPEIAKYYLSPLISKLSSIGIAQIDHFLIPDGEQFKTLQTVEQVWSVMLANHYPTDALLIGLGGGMIGDITGFSAACYKRGISFIQCPTSLLAQVDASIGGKTGVNHSLGKNMIGAFHQPEAVIIDLATLSTLPEREFIAGLAEVIKYGLALDVVFFNWLEENIEDILQRKPDVLQPMVTKACQIKAHIVSEDERDQNLRKMLNFGHTLAHALESLLNYQQLLHGEAVSIGMVLAMEISMLQGTLAPICFNRALSLLRRARLPIKLPEYVTDSDIWSRIKHDKKYSMQGLHWVLLNALGESRLCNFVTQQQMTRALLNTKNR